LDSFENSIEDLRRRFIRDWDGNIRPSLGDYVRQVAAKDRPAAIAALIPIDIQKKFSLGLSPLANDYAMFGKHGVQLASSFIGDSICDSPCDASTIGAEMVSEELQATTASIQIDHYRLLEAIGEGGMGAVWVAEQEYPVRRRVALKVIRAGLAPKDAIARFEVERQAIALMDHQNIAKVLDAGTTQCGSPFFAMEFVNGIPLNDYCNKHQFTIDQRLELMVPVCLAVQHAHQKGIIHRDLKHSNVLVMESDGKPVPKIIDFGLAKALGSTLTEQTMHTEVGKILGTLHYMSPEQAEANNKDIDTRSDIYSLGVMLYKLLTGHTPLNFEQTREMSFLSALKVVQEKTPVRPSDCIDSAVKSVEKICENRKTEPAKLAAKLKGELDCILLKTLEKERSERYETANSLAVEIQRYLNDEPLIARPRSTIYTSRKFIQRNRKLVASVATIVFLLVSGIVATSLATYWAMKETRRANRESEVAKQETENAKEATAKAQESEHRRESLQEEAELQLRAMRLKSAWSDWQLGNTESARQRLNDIPEQEQSWESRFLRRQFDSSEKVLYGHSRRVTAVASSSEGEFLASGGWDCVLRIWDAKRMELMHTYFLDEVVADIAFSTDGKIACSDRSNLITILEASTGEVIKELGPYPSDINCIEFSPDNKLLVAGSHHQDSYRFRSDRKFRGEFEPLISLICLATGATEQELSGHSESVTGVSWSDDGQTIVSSSHDQTLRTWRKENGKFQLDQLIRDHDFPITSVAVSRSGDMAVSCDKKSIRLWDLENGQLIRTIFGHTDDVRSVRFSPDDSRIVSASKDGTAIVWTVAGETVLECRGHFAAINSACFSSDGRWVMTASDDNTLCVWNAQNNPSIVEFKPHSDVVWATDLSPDGLWVVSAGEDGMVAISNAATGQLYGSKFAHFREVSARSDPPIPFRQPSSSEADHSVLSLAVTNDGQSVITSGGDGFVRVWDFHSQQLIHEFRAHDGLVWSLDLSPDGTRLASVGGDGCGRIWSTEDWSLLGSLARNKEELASVKFSPNGQLLVTAGDDRIVSVWSATTFELEHQFSGHPDAVWRAVFSPDSKRIASSGFLGEIILWDLETKEQNLYLEGHTAQIAGLAFSPDGKRIISASDDGTIKFWEVQSGIELFVLRDVGETYAVHVSFSQCGNKMVVGGKEWVTVRSAVSTGSVVRSFLPQDALQLTMKGLVAVVGDTATEGLLCEHRANAKRCCKFFPSFESFTLLGIANYRLGNFPIAVEALEEAMRTEALEYGQPDLRPDIEGYLAMAYYQTGDRELAEELKAKFMAEMQESWHGDEVAIYIQSQLNELFKGTYE
jgi:WD40 repeat protein